MGPVGPTGQFTAFAAGLVLAALTFWVLRRATVATRQAALAAVLGLIAVVYLVFPLAAGQPRWLWLEALGVAVYGGVALMGLRYRPWLLVLGLAGHTAWDMLHGGRVLAEMVPGWYRGLCYGYDLGLAGLLALTLRPRRQAD